MIYIGLLQFCLIETNKVVNDIFFLKKDSISVTYHILTVLWIWKLLVYSFKSVNLHTIEIFEGKVENPNIPFK